MVALVSCLWVVQPLLELSVQVIPGLELLAAQEVILEEGEGSLDVAFAILVVDLANHGFEGTVPCEVQEPRVPDGLVTPAAESDRGHIVVDDLFGDALKVSQGVDVRGEEGGQLLIAVALHEQHPTVAQDHAEAVHGAQDPRDHHLVRGPVHLSLLAWALLDARVGLAGRLARPTDRPDVLAEDRAAPLVSDGADLAKDAADGEALLSLLGDDIPVCVELAARRLRLGLVVEVCSPDRPADALDADPEATGDRLLGPAVRPQAQDLGADVVAEVAHGCSPG